ncbi:acyl-CoA Delta(11) desaturase [Bombus bifarius]|uniref:Acyl-CoA Delta(11) desaturase n=1 Tax=Bombus bifarius TaxID=103933 RepID=A0A6P8N5V2_9HYME|nr:acyl-CoA Delta(11) desaturase [Bombus vancouverensis nearcticus]XP_033310005.1 acyl-CoA Delta(11) desaturase [Bombus bifarius]
MRFKQKPKGRSTRLMVRIRLSSSFPTIQKRVSCYRKSAMLDEKQPARKQEMKWAAILWYIYIHVLGVYAIWFLFTSAKWMTVIFTLFITTLGCLGVTAGAHRLWAHGTYEATGSLRLLLMLFHTLAGVGSIHDWVLYHRLHHKYYGTDKDPYNHKKGFFYSHYVGNILSPSMDLEEIKREIDMRDIEQDGYVWFQKKFYWPLFIIFGLILPLNAPLEYWDESMTETILITGVLRFAITVNVSWLVNSARLIWSMETQKLPQDNISVFFLTKSFWPMYHYMVPWDWKCGEFGSYADGCATFFIKIWHELGYVTLLQTTDSEDVREMLHEVSKKKMTLAEGLGRLKEKSMYNAKKLKLMVKN